MNLELITTIANYVIVILAILVVYLIGNKFAKSYDDRNKREISLLEMSVVNSISELNTTIDTIISESLSEYVTINGISGILYIAPELEDEIREAVMKAVSSRISNTLLNRIKLFYQPELIPEVIAKKIFLAVSIYVASVNTQK